METSSRERRFRTMSRKRDPLAHEAPPPAAGETDEAYFARRAAEELEIAAKTTDPAVKRTHLDLAALYATKREIAARQS